MQRPDQHHVFLEMAAVLSKRAMCLRRRVACILVDDQGHVVSTGYNGRPRAMGNCGPSDSCGNNCEGVHAEVNALLQAKRQASLAYVTHAPCWHCAKTLANSGIAAVYYTDGSTLELKTLDFCRDTGIQLKELRNE